MLDVFSPPKFSVYFDENRYRMSKMIELFVSNKINETCQNHIAVNNSEENGDVDINIFERKTNLFLGQIEIIDAGKFGDKLYLPERKAVAKPKHLLMWFYRYIDVKYPCGRWAVYPSKNLMASDFLSEKKPSINGRQDFYREFPKDKISVDVDLKKMMEAYFK